MKRFILVVTLACLALGSLACLGMGTGTALRAKLIAAHPEWPAIAIEHINAGRIAVGMDQDMVRAVIGYPDDINETVTAGGKHTQWVYSQSWYRARAMYVYFENGRCTAYQL